ncbi:hypothetical protein GCM10010293_22930 [Streptomyces griseoflavus]|nr:hypothetical protein GCM10010293_22930 [Streptomyces griseoflavus]
MAGNKRGSGFAGGFRHHSAVARRAMRAGLCLITRVRQRGHGWIVRLRFELYVNLVRKEFPEE